MHVLGGNGSGVSGEVGFIDIQWLGFCIMASVDVISARKNGVAPQSIYVFGERNSGTNYVHHLITRNCVLRDTQGRLYDAANAAAFGWKHGFPNMFAAPENVLAIAVYREPIAWLQSLCRAPWHTAPHLRNLPFSDFIRREWQGVIDDEHFGFDKNSAVWGKELMSDRDPLTGLRFANAMRLRNAKNRGFATLDNRFGNVLRLRYEEVVAQPEVFLNALCKNYGFVRRSTFNPIEHDRATPGRGAFVAKPVQPISAADQAFIHSELDWSIEKTLGYGASDALLQQVA